MEYYQKLDRGPPNPKAPAFPYVNFTKFPFPPQTNIVYYNPRIEIVRLNTNRTAFVSLGFGMLGVFTPKATKKNDEETDEKEKMEMNKETIFGVYFPSVNEWFFKQKTGGTRWLLSYDKLQFSTIFNVSQEPVDITIKFMVQENAQTFFNRIRSQGSLIESHLKPSGKGEYLKYYFALVYPHYRIDISAYPTI